MRRIGVTTGALLLGAVLASAIGAGHALAQQDASEAGPPLRANLSAARSAAEPTAASPDEGILPRYIAFQRDFARDFGLRLAVGEGDEEQSLLDQIQSKLERKWGDRTLYGWLERCIALYAQFEAATRTKQKGFEMSLDVDDAAEGRVGLQMSRALE